MAGESHKTIKVDPLTLTSLYLKLQVNKHHLSTATGFVVQEQNRYFLVSNWHVFSGRNAETGKPLSDTAGIPDEVRIAHHLRKGIGHWRFHGESLLNSDGSPRWTAHPKGQEVDVAVLELSNVKLDVAIYPFDLSLAGLDMVPAPAMTVSVIGFPFGLRPNVFFPIWKTGHVATDPEIPYKGYAAFLIDATTREGMSGSPVVMRPTGYYQTSDGEYVMDISCQTKFLGIYSGRIHDTPL